MRRPLLALPAIAAALVLFPSCATSAPHPTILRSPVPVRLAGVTEAVADTPAPSTPNQALQPGQVKHPGEKCATTIQPADGQGCPGPPSNLVNGRPWCVGTPFEVGECLAAEQGFFDPSANFQPRNPTESCIATRESGNTYYPPMHGYFGRWQDSESLWRDHGGQADWGTASPAEQDYVFVNIVAADGYAPWLAFDGC